MNEVSEIRESLKDLLHLIRAASELVTEAEGVQWQAPTHRSEEKQPEEPEIRQKGLISDPTSRTALDPQRMALRAELAVLGSEVRSMSVQLSNTIGYINACLEPYR